MTERDKRLAIIWGTVLAAILLILFTRRGTGAGAVGAAGTYMLPTATGPSLGPTYVDGPKTFVIPGLDLSGPNLNMIGACCSDCMNGPQFTKPVAQPVVFNQNNAAATVVNWQYNPYRAGSYGAVGYGTTGG